MHRDIARYLLLLALVRALVDVVLVSASPGGTRPRRRLRPATVTRHTVTDQRHVSPVTDHRPAPPVTGAGRPAPPQSARPDRASPSDLDISGTDQPPPRSRRATRRGRGDPRSRKRGCRGGQRWRACSRGRDDICITSININAIPRKILPLRHHLHGTVTDICLVQETWLKKPVPKRFTTFPGYNMVHADRENRTGDSVRRSVLPTLVSSLVISIIRYCLSIYGSCTKRNLTRLQRVINFGARVISGRRRRDHISDVIRDLKWLSASQLHTYHALCLMRRLLANSEPHSLAQKLVRRHNIRQTQTRQDDHLDLPVIKTEYGRRRFFYRTADVFNRLPSRISVRRIGAFKRRLRAYLADAVP